MWFLMLALLLLRTPLELPRSTDLPSYNDVVTCRPIASGRLGKQARN
jgi:hypothetical protein